MSVRSTLRSQKILRHIEAEVKRQGIWIPRRTRPKRYKTLLIKESFEPLHLCVSSKYPELYKVSCKYVEDLLNPIYEQYNEFCSKKNNNHQYVSLKKIESLSVKN